MKQGGENAALLYFFQRRFSALIDVQLRRGDVAQNVAVLVVLPYSRGAAIGTKINFGGKIIVW